MPTLSVVTARWTGFPGGPGTSTFFFFPGSWTLTALKDFYGLLAGIIPSSVTIQVENSGPNIDDETGNLVGAWSKTAVPAIPGSNSGDYAAGVGAVVRWNTSSVVDNHTVKGHTYIVPIAGVVFDTNGTIDAGNLALIQSTATTTQTAYATDLKVWHRPRKASTAHPVARPGSQYAVTSATAVDRTAILRSRRA